MNGNSSWMIYGANGFTGRMVAREAKRMGHAPILAGRNQGAVKALAEELSLPWRAFDVAHPDPTHRGLEGVSIVAHCAGPFSATSQPMIDACLALHAHYLDITGEIDVFVRAEQRHEEAVAAGIVLCPGVGFDVIPTDCLAACLKEALPDATHLALGFQGLEAQSPGTARSSIEGAGLGGRVRENGRIVAVPLGERTRTIDFGAGPRNAAALPWGDVATAYFTTGIPNIETYIAASRAMVAKMRRVEKIRPLLRFGPTAALMKMMAAKTSRGPSEQDLRTSKTYVWGEARNAKGEIRTARVVTTNGYRLTADGVMLAVRTLHRRAPNGGYYTPSQLMGPRCVEKLPESGTIRID